MTFPGMHSATTASSAIKVDTTNMAATGGPNHAIYSQIFSKNNPVASAKRLKDSNLIREVAGVHFQIRRPKKNCVVEHVNINKHDKIYHVIL